MSSYTTETVHQAPTDGIVVAYLQGGASGSTTLYGYTGPTSGTSNLIAKYIINESGATVTIMMPVKKDEYWKITDSVGGFNTASSKISWLPLGQ